VWVIDTNKEANAVKEARKLGIPVVAVLDTNCDPDVVDFPIPGNDDALRSVALLTRVIADAVAEGLVARTARTVGNEDTAEAALKAWAAELAAEMEAKAAADAPVADAPAADAPAEVAAGDAPVADAPAEVAAADAPAADADTQTPDETA
jgi:small subunit ribosomal protein S2